MPPKISSAEWEVMNVVWERHPMTAAQVFEALPNHNEWAQKTVNTFLTRLVEKGVLRVEKEGNVNIYSPRLPRAECMASERKDFLRRVYQGSAASLLMHFCENAELSEAEIRELQRLLRKKKGE